MKIDFNCCTRLSFVVFITNLLSNWYVYLCEGTPPVPPYLANWWFWLCVLGTVTSTILLCLDFSNCDDLCFVSPCVFLATVFEDLPLLILSLVTMSSMSSAGGTGVADLLPAFTYSSLASLIVSVFRLVNVLALGCPNCTIRIRCCTICDLCLCLLYMSVSILSCAVFFKSCETHQSSELCNFVVVMITNNM